MFPCYLATLSLQVQANSQFYKIHQTKIVKKKSKKKIKKKITQYKLSIYFFYGTRNDNIIHVTYIFIYTVFLNMNVKLVLNSFNFASVILGHKEGVSRVHT